MLLRLRGVPEEQRESGRPSGEGPHATDQFQRRQGASRETASGNRASLKNPGSVRVDGLNATQQMLDFHLHGTRWITLLRPLRRTRSVPFFHCDHLAEATIAVSGAMRPCACHNRNRHDTRGVERSGLRLSPAIKLCIDSSAWRVNHQEAPRFSATAATNQLTWYRASSRTASSSKRPLRFAP